MRSRKIFMLQVKQIEDGVPKGIVRHLFMDDVHAFCGLDQAILAMNSMMDYVGRPQAFTELRQFSNEEKKKEEPDWLFCDDRERDEKRKEFWEPYVNQDFFWLEEKAVAKFMITVGYRQNSSWQGEVIWVKHGKSYFRSVLELLSLMYSAFPGETILFSGSGA